MGLWLAALSRLLSRQPDVRRAHDRTTSENNNASNYGLVCSAKLVSSVFSLGLASGW